MKKLRLIAAVLLALPLIAFGAGYLAGQVPVMDAEGPGVEILKSMREGGLMTFISLSHVIVGVLLLVPRTRFAGALTQLPLSLGILAFHATLLPEGLAPAVVMVVLNLLVLADAPRVQKLLGE